jgi:chorismate dehydratase
MDKTVKISAVSYLNTVPFIYGIENSGFVNNFILEKDIPSVCADKLINGDVDIGLVPVASLPFVKNYKIISNYCISSFGPVKTVLLLAKKPINEVNNIYLDFHSRTSINLAKILSTYHWKLKMRWIPLKTDNIEEIKRYDAVVCIGDKTFLLENEFEYVYDLAEEWRKFTGMPAVFACWAANKELPGAFMDDFNKALKFGVENMNKAAEMSQNGIISNQRLKQYLSGNIDYDLNNSKKEAIKKYLELLDEVQSIEIL